MQCPTCMSPVAYNGNSYRPFCSQRCKLIDLGRWASGGFRIPVAESPSEEDQVAPGGDDGE